MRSRWAFRAAVLLVAALAVSVGPAPEVAQAGTLGVIGGEMLDVQAQRLEVDVEKGTALLQGEVTATLGELNVYCPKVEIRYDQAPQVQWARGTGGVRATLKGIEARASTVELDVPKRRVKLSGGVRLSRGKGWVKAERATIDLATRKVSLSEVKGSIPVQPPNR